VSRLLKARFSRGLFVCRQGRPPAVGVVSAANLREEGAGRHGRCAIADHGQVRQGQCQRASHRPLEAIGVAAAPSRPPGMAREVWRQFLALRPRERDAWAAVRPCVLKWMASRPPMRGDILAQPLLLTIDRAPDDTAPAHPVAPALQSGGSSPTPDCGFVTPTARLASVSSPVGPLFPVSHALTSSGTASSSAW
jgi:hypothetical protein